LFPLFLIANARISQRRLLAYGLHPVVIIFALLSS
jgi:hypothetical protein